MNIEWESYVLQVGTCIIWENSEDSDVHFKSVFSWTGMVIPFLEQLLLL